MNVKTVVTSLLLGLGLNASVAAKDYAIALTPNVSTEVAKQHYSAAIGFLVAMQPGDTALILDGEHLATLGTFTIPTNPIYNSPKARFMFNKAVAANMAKFAKAAKAPSNGVNGAVRLPQLLRHIATNKSGAAIDVIVLGSALYDEQSDSAFSMKGGIFPGDGHLKYGRDVTPFGIANPAQLAGLSLHIGHSDHYPSDRHHYYIQRFWSLYMQAQSGKLVSFTSDIPTLFNRAKTGQGAPQNDYKASDTDKLEMIRLAPLKVKQQSIYNRPLTKAALSRKQVRKAHDVQIGISWQCDCDLDLYAVAYPGAPVLWFGHTKSEQGIYFKDYQQAPGAENNGFETIAYSVPIDLRALKLYVAFYRGKAPKGVNGEVRISVDGKTYNKAFHIAATEGDATNNALVTIKSSNITSKNIIAINPLDVIAL